LDVISLDPKRNFGEDKTNLLYVPLVRGSLEKINGSSFFEKGCNSKSMRGWGLKNIFMLSKALEAKNVLRLIQGTRLWAQVTKAKYLP